LFDGGCVRTTASKLIGRPAAFAWCQQGLGKEVVAGFDKAQIKNQKASD
jgi:hypothetical protein